MPDSGNMPEPDENEPAALMHLALPVSQKVVLVIDLVESVRLMAADEAGTVARWRDFAQTAQNHTIPAHQGRLVKSLGDGLMVEFENPRDAANTAHALHAVMQKGNAGQSAERHMHLRAGINATHVYTDHNDIYGAGVNLAARIATLAGPGETVVTAQVRDGLTDGLDATIEDLGECYLKHIDEPVRAYRVGAAGQAPVVVAQREYATPLQPTIAVIPFTARSNEPEHFAIGELIADGVICQLSGSGDMAVVSRLSATVFRGTAFDLSELQQKLGANYVVTGSYVVVGSKGLGQLLVSVELADAKSAEIIWFDRFSAEVGDLLEIESECTQRVAQACHMAVLKRESRRAQSQPIATLAAYTLKIGGVNMMHKSGLAEFDKGRLVLQALAERYRQQADIHAWIAKWHVLRVIRGNSPNPAHDAQLAMDECRRALDGAPEHSLALAVKGYTLCQLLGEPSEAGRLLDQARELAPSEVHAWLYRSVWSSNFGDPKEGVAEALKARSLSPLDPHVYFFDSLLATAYTCNREYGLATLAANQSLKLNRDHAPTLRTLIVAQYESGNFDGAKGTLAQLRKTTPLLSISTYEAMGSRDSPSRRRVVAAFRFLGVPESV